MAEQDSQRFFIGLIWLVWTIMVITWHVRNPIAGPMTPFTRIGHVISFDRMAEYQTPVETHSSMPYPHPPL